MTNNDVLRRIRYIFDINDSKMISIFALAGADVTRSEVSDWLKQEDDPAFVRCDDRQFACFLNGLISERRGKRDEETPKLESRLTNNMIFLKLKIALNLKAEDVLTVLEKADFRMSKNELSAFFRRAGHKNYRECKDQILRNFLNGLQVQYRGDCTDSDA